MRLIVKSKGKFQEKKDSSKNVDLGKRFVVGRWQQFTQQYFYVTNVHLQRNFGHYSINP